MRLRLQEALTDAVALPAFAAILCSTPVNSVATSTHCRLRTVNGMFAIHANGKQTEKSHDTG
jgi:hypothetical protein